jgi:hypothetical protein
MMIGIKNKKTKTGAKNKNKKNLNYNIITGLIHSREIITLSMNILIIFNLLRDKDNIEKDLIHLFVPIINVDSFKVIENHYKND